jgi:hypothetical protein
LAVLFEVAGDDVEELSVASGGSCEPGVGGPEQHLAAVVVVGGHLRAADLDDRLGVLEHLANRIPVVAHYAVARRPRLVFDVDEDIGRVGRVDGDSQ